MKKKLSFSLLVIIICIGSIGAQNQFFYTDNGKISVTPDFTSYIIHTHSGDVLDRLATNRAAGIQAVSAFAHKSFAIVQLDQAQPNAEDLRLATGLKENIKDVSPAYLLEDGHPIYATHTVVFKPRLKENISAITQVLGNLNIVSVNEQYGIFRVEIEKVSDAFLIANKLYESGLTLYAHPDFYSPKSQNTDPLLSQQFQMNNTGQTIDGYSGLADMDCNALEAWGVTLGSNAITVAVIDDGLESHEDLNDSNGNSRVIGGYTPANNGNGSTTNNSNHGVACAGIVAASHNNLGVQGVAPLVKLLSVNIFYGGETTQDIADGITWAKNNGADVMSNSWGYTSCTANFSNINNAISDAVNNGRGGLGSVIVFASGNGYKSCVDYPANNSNVIAVGAFTNQGNKSDYSNGGSDLDIAAPSNAVSPQPGAGVRTTDRMGNNGYASGNYTGGFGGTSAACPVVSGVVALVLGYNPSLTDAQIKNILYSTATDMGSSGYDTQFGNGRVNAYGALLAAGGTQPTCNDGVQNGQETGVDCGGPDCSPCPSGCNDNEVTVSITLDNYPEETSWNIVNALGSIVASGGTYGNQPDGSNVSDDLCLVDGCYDFTISDTYGDGICCAYGSGSYVVSFNGTTLASGGSFGSTETTNFCLGGGPSPDTEAPSIPTNLTATNTTQTSTDLNWNASSDNIAVTGYNVYVDGVLIGNTNNTNYGVTGLAAGNTYTMAISALDAAGNESGTATTNVTTPEAPTPDTEAPTTPINLDANNTTQTSTDLNWTASTDNVAVTSYNVYVDGVLIGNTANTSYAVTGLTADNTYTLAVSALDAAGNESGTATTNVTTLSNGGGGSDLIFAHYFETGWDGWQDGGSDCFRYSGTRSWEGNYSIRIRDNSGNASAMTSPTYDLSSYNFVDFEFFFYPNSMENGENFFVEYDDGSGWSIIADYVRGTDFNNNTFYSAVITLEDGFVNLSNTARFRIRCDASGNNDKVYIDQVSLTGYESLPTLSYKSAELTALATDLSSQIIASVFPNPASDVVTIQTDSEIDQVTIFSMDGRVIDAPLLINKNNSAELNVDHLAPGIYLLQVHTAEGTTTEKLIKQ